MHAPLTHRRALLQLLAALAAPWPLASSAQVSLSTALNRTARFRALSQRCAKAYAQLFLDVLPDNAHDTLSTAQRLIQGGFDELARASLSPAVALLVGAVQKESAALAQQLTQPLTRTSLLGVAQQSDRMLAAADKATQALQDGAQAPTAKIVNVAGRQRMLSQRMAKNYFLAAAAVPGAREQIGSDAAEFRSALASLAQAPVSTVNIRNELQLAESQWVFFSSAVQKKAEPEALRTVATTSERLLDVMNNLTNLYDAALKDVLGSA